MKLYESGENYLETILVLNRKNGSVRSIDIANEMGFSKPSISRAMNILKSANFIGIDKNGLITLTNEGFKKAENILERHIIITKFLINHLGVSEEFAEVDACRIEHVISDETFDKIKMHLGE
jgi:Mn-dependent DtxR family transcriptional regulator